MILIRACFGDVLQSRVYYFVPGIISLSASLYSKCTVFLVNICYLQVLAVYKKVSTQTKSIMDKSAFLYWWFFFEL